MIVVTLSLLTVFAKDLFPSKKIQRSVTYSLFVERTFLCHSSGALSVTMVMRLNYFKERKKEVKKFRRLRESQFAKSSAWKKTIARTVFFILCFLGFSYQACDFLHYYYQYPVTVNVEESNPFEIILPAFTFCNNNRLRRLSWCEARESLCETYDDTEIFCKDYPRYCHNYFDREEMKIPVVNFLDIPDIVGWEDVEKFSASNENMIEICELHYGENDELCKARRVPFTKPNNAPSYCRTVNSYLHDPDAESAIYPNSLFIEMEMSTHPEEYFHLDDPVFIYASVHNNIQMVNPFREGYELVGGASYEANIASTEIERLPPPYNTNCYDYIKAWKENNGTGPTTQVVRILIQYKVSHSGKSQKQFFIRNIESDILKECIAYCNLASVLSEGGCVDEQIPVSHTERLCNTTFEKPTTTDEIIKNCTLHCQPACFERIYEVEYRKLTIPASDCDLKYNTSFLEHCKVKTVHIEYSFRKFRLKRQTYQAKYNSVELFSYVGGYLGLWLGISLVSIFDLCESFCKVLCNSKKKKGFKKFQATSKEVN
ncbi:degenerin mec-4-like [Parasteatoda tepidariorum]|uniref:degenerin mec-4-like n=1 Tax=Parasteatoda tepidariorum TaxID=114398 RepID=UPI0039BCB074